MLSDELNALDAESFEIMDIEEPERLLAGSTTASGPICRSDHQYADRAPV